MEPHAALAQQPNVHDKVYTRATAAVARSHSRHATYTDEEWAKRLSKRRAAVAVQKSRDDYQAYIQAVPPEERSKSMPTTPEASPRLSKREWETQMWRWRQELRVWDLFVRDEESFPAFSSQSSATWTKDGILFQCIQNVQDHMYIWLADTELATFHQCSVTLSSLLQTTLRSRCDAAHVRVVYRLLDPRNSQLLLRKRPSTYCRWARELIPTWFHPSRSIALSRGLITCSSPDGEWDEPQMQAPAPFISATSAATIDAAMCPCWSHFLRDDPRTWVSIREMDGKLIRIGFEAPMSCPLDSLQSADEESASDEE